MWLDLAPVQSAIKQGISWFLAPLRTLNFHHIDTVRNVHVGLQSMLFFDDNVIKMFIGCFLLSRWYKWWRYYVILQDLAWGAEIWRLFWLWLILISLLVVMICRLISWIIDISWWIHESPGQKPDWFQLEKLLISK